jgi:hypothetical protein
MSSTNQNAGGPLTSAFAIADFNSSQLANPVAATISLNQRITGKVPHGRESPVLIAEL